MNLIVNNEELHEMYSTGRGGFKIQAQWKQEKNSIIINSLPYQASGSKILEQIAEQMLNKKLPMVVDLADEGDHEDPIRLVITLKSKRVNGPGTLKSPHPSLGPAAKTNAVKTQVKGTSQRSRGFFTSPYAQQPNMSS